MPDGQLDSVAGEMMASAAQVLSALVDRGVTAGATSSSVSESSLRVEEDWVATKTDIPSLSAGFICRYPKADLAKIVALMVGAEPGGEMDAMQLSIVAETVAQISSAMGEHLAQALGNSTEGIVSGVVGDTGSFPPPPFTTYEAELEITGEFPVAVQVDFDGVALSKLGAAEKPAAAPSAAAAAPAAPLPRAAAPAAAEPPRRQAPTAPAKPAQFANMAPTGVTTAAPGHSNLDLVHDIPLQISAVLGQTSLALRDVVAMQAGSVFELDKLSADPIDLFVNNILIARGEVVVVDDKYAVKISELNPLQHERA
ncbi:MAG TPA: flagellar motor switch protein FliN [Candidatus Baltobacteraceae bacterium]|jgi:flagellar motor switch protein FliN/FliY